MVSFVCDQCQTTLRKAKVDQHYWGCRMDSVSCVDCGNTFWGDDFKSHTSCISEAEKHMGSLYPGNKKKQDLAESKESKEPPKIIESDTKKDEKTDSKTDSDSQVSLEIVAKVVGDLIKEVRLVSGIGI